MSSVPAIRVRRLNEAGVRPDGRYVLYWMTGQRRLGWNFALDHALGLAEGLGHPLLIFEAVNADYPWASPRHHEPILVGMREHQDALSDSAVGYYPYAEPTPRAGRGLLRALAAEASYVVTDDGPTFFTPRLLEAASRLDGVAVDAVDSCGLLPLREPGRTFSAAYHFRRHLHKALPDWLGSRPSRAPLDAWKGPRFEGVDTGIVSRWAPTTLRPDLPGAAAAVPGVGGSQAGHRRLRSFVADRLARYDEDKNHPDADAASGLSPWLHYGQLSTHEIFEAVAEHEEWTPLRLSDHADGRRSGWWGMSPPAEAFLDQLITWRELGFNYCVHEPDFARYETLPEWARSTLETHASDPRPHLYTVEEFDRADTHDELWNAAQRQLRAAGVIHNYLRMLWGKKILEWSPDPRSALSTMIELNNRYAVDGRDPNSYSGIFWTMGRFDRGWPEREVFGKVRSMTSASTRRKVRVERYLERWGPEGRLDLDGSVEDA